MLVLFLSSLSLELQGLTSPGQKLVTKLSLDHCLWRIQLESTIYGDLVFRIF